MQNNTSQHISKAAAIGADALERDLLVDIGEQAIVAGIVAGLDGMVKQGKESYEAYKNGEQEGSEIFVEVITTGAKKAAGGSMRAAAAIGLKEGVREVSKRLGWRSLWRLTIRHSQAVTAIAFGVVDQSWDTIKLANGQLTERDYKINTLKNVGSTGGAIGGAATGAAIGSVVPGVGTTLGTVLGAYLGSYGASEGLRSLGEQWLEKEDTDKESDSSNP